MEINDYPVISGDYGEWSSGYELGKTLEHLFPGQCGADLAYAIIYHLAHDFDGVRFTDVFCEKYNYDDGGDFAWIAKTDTGRLIRITGWHDFTGWDCQSDASWVYLT